MLVAPPLSGQFGAKAPHAPHRGFRRIHSQASNLQGRNAPSNCTTLLDPKSSALIDHTSAIMFTWLTSKTNLFDSREIKRDTPFEQPLAAALELELQPVMRRCQKHCTPLHGLELCDWA
jgi:hypothetical protein